MADINETTLMGRLGADPEVKTFNNGGKIVNLRIATSEKWTDKNSGEKKERTEWHMVTLTGDGLCKYAEQYLRKGARVHLRGKLTTRKWQDQAGNDRYSTEVVVGMGGRLDIIDFPDDGGQRGGGADRGRNSDSGAGGGQTHGGNNGYDDDSIPF